MATKKKGAPKGERPSERAMRVTQDMAKPDDFTADMESGAQPEAFLFTDEHPMLVGKVMGFSEGFDPKYRHDAYPIVIVRDEATGQDVSVHVFHTALQSQLERANPTLGDRIGIRYLGKRAPKGGGNEYKNFVVRIDGAHSAKRTFRDTMPVQRVLPGEYEPEEAQDDLPF